MKKYDYLIVGSGPSGAVFAHEACKKGKKCLVIEKRAEVGGNLRTDVAEDIIIHRYGAHIFHTKDETVWNYVRQFAKFNHFVNSPIANYKGELYNLPFNMNTFNRMWGVITPDEAQEKISHQRGEFTGEPRNLEEQALQLVGRDIYEKLIKGYTEKQWGRPCDQLPAFIIRRLPVRFTFDNHYFSDPWQGIPIGGYTPMIEKMLEGVEVQLNTDFLLDRKSLTQCAETILYSGPIDAWYDFRFGPLTYRSLKFETKTLPLENFQGNAVINYTDAETPFTRIIEHKHFEFGNQQKTIITYEYPHTWEPGEEAYYPVNDEENQTIYQEYAALAAAEKNVLFSGRLAQYAYFDMDKVIAQSLRLASQI